MPGLRHECSIRAQNDFGLRNCGELFYTFSVTSTVFLYFAHESSVLFKMTIHRHIQKLSFDLKILLIPYELVRTVV